MKTLRRYEVQYKILEGLIFRGRFVAHGFSRLDAVNAFIGYMAKCGVTNYCIVKIKHVAR